MGEREISAQVHEEWYRGTVAGALEHFASPRGEFTLVLEPWAGDCDGEVRQCAEGHEGRKGDARVDRQAGRQTDTDRQTDRQSPEHSEVQQSADQHAGKEGPGG